MSELGERIRITREKRGMSKRMLATRIHHSIASVSAYEAGAQLPPTDVLMSIAEALGVTAAYLLGEEKAGKLSTDGLTEQQRDFAELLFAEFCSPTVAEGSRKLSAQQEALLIQMLELFLK